MRGLRALLVVLVLLGLLAVGVDRVLVLVAEDRIASVAAQQTGLPEEPDVSIEGFPFLTQALGGEYDSVRIGIDVAAAGLPPGARADIRLQGVQAALREVVSGSLDALPVERLTGTAVFPFDYLGEQLDGATVSRDGSGVRVESSIDFLGQDFPFAATADVALIDNDVLLDLTDVSGLGVDVPDEVVRAVEALIDVTIPVPELPFGLVFSDLAVTDAGVEVSAVGEDIVLERTPG